MASAADTAWITKRAKELGFDLCGVVRVEEFPELAHFEEWLARGYAGEMNYLEDPRRRNPALVQENLRSAIVCALNYNTDLPYSVDAAAAKTASRAVGYRDTPGGATIMKSFGKSSMRWPLLSGKDFRSRLPRALTPTPDRWPSVYSPNMRGWAGSAKIRCC